MAKNDNLKDFLTDVANAIREKKGTTDLINPQDFSAEIASIKSGGGEGGGGNDVIFRDCDGTILHSYSKDNFLALTELPPLPTREGLICQEWNYNFADAVEYVNEYGVLEVGATYITDDGKTRLYISVSRRRQDVPLYFYQSVANGVTIDWGDGATETLSGTKKVNTTHHYNAIGDYVISLEVADGCTLNLGHDSSSYCVMGSSGSAGKVYCNMLKKVEIGRGVGDIYANAFRYCYSLETITLPIGITRLGGYCFQYCGNLVALVIPKGVTSIGALSLNYATSLKSISIPKGVTSIGSFGYTTSLKLICIPEGVSDMDARAFEYCYSLESVIIPNGLTSINGNAFDYCYALKTLNLPQGISLSSRAFRNCNALSSVRAEQGAKSIGSEAFSYCQSLANVRMAGSVESIVAGAFAYCTGVAFYDFSDIESIPSLEATNAFSSIPSDCKIIVPDALYDEWIAATNWSTYASKIIKKSDWDAQNA